MLENEEGKMVYSMAVSPLTGTRYCWGIGGTNFCKNMEYIGCTLSRFDAHQGLYNGKIIDCTMNFFALTGNGTMVIENTNWYSAGTHSADNYLLYLRGDYGSTWAGDIFVKNCTATVGDADFNLIYHSYNNFDFGYTCHFPNVYLDNLVFKGLKEGQKINFIPRKNSVDKEPNLHKDTILNIHPQDGTAVDGVLWSDESSFKNLNKVVPPKRISIKNNIAGHVYSIPDAPFFEETDFSECEEGSLIFE
jgi:hypothetical protein